MLCEKRSPSERSDEWTECDSLNCDSGGGALVVVEAGTGIPKCVVNAWFDIAEDSCNDGGGDGEGCSPSENTESACRNDTVRFSVPSSASPLEGVKWALVSLK